MSKRKISPFTQEILQEIYEDNGIITMHQFNLFCVSIFILKKPQNFGA